jgi:hypothetical protein
LGYRVGDHATPEFPDAPEAGHEYSSLDAAMGFLRIKLAQGPQASAELLAEAEETEGLSVTTTQRAKKKLGVVSKRVGDAWTWALPAERLN